MIILFDVKGIDLRTASSPVITLLTSINSHGLQFTKFASLSIIICYCSSNSRSIKRNGCCSIYYVHNCDDSNTGFYVVPNAP